MKLLPYLSVLQILLCVLIGFYYFSSIISSTGITLPFDDVVMRATAFILLNIISIIRYCLILGFDSTIKKIVTVTAVSITAFFIVYFALEPSSIGNLVCAISGIITIITWNLTDSKLSKKTGIENFLPFSFSKKRS